MLTISDWLNAPREAMFHAVDGRTRLGHWFVNEPTRDLNGKHIWLSPGEVPQESRLFDGYFDWTKTLRERPFDTYPCRHCGAIHMIVVEDRFWGWQIVCLSCRGCGPAADSLTEAWRRWAKGAESAVGGWYHSKIYPKT